jgi:hypothetical protein
MFHIQLRQFPHSHTQFNLSDEDVRSLAKLWVAGNLLLVGDRKWNPHDAKLTILEGPELPVGQLAMGRGWRNAERAGEDVTQRVLREALASAGPSAPDPGAASEASAASRATVETGDAAELLSLLGEDARARELLATWRRIAPSFPERAPSECLALAERELEAESATPPR